MQKPLFLLIIVAKLIVFKHFFSDFIFGKERYTIKIKEHPFSTSYERNWHDWKFIEYEKTSKGVFVGRSFWTVMVFTPKFFPKRQWLWFSSTDILRCWREIGNDQLKHRELPRRFKDKEPHEKPIPQPIVLLLFDETVSSILAATTNSWWYGMAKTTNCHSNYGFVEG